MRAFAALCELPESQLVEDLAGLHFLEVITGLRLARGKDAQGGRRQTRAVGQRLKLVIRLSRPNSAMNQGRPAAGSVAPPPGSGRILRAPRSPRLAR